MYNSSVTPTQPSVNPAPLTAGGSSTAQLAPNDNPPPVQAAGLRQPAPFAVASDTTVSTLLPPEPPAEAEAYAALEVD